MQRTEETPGEHETTSEGEVLRTTSPEAADAFIAKLVESGGKIVQISPHRQSLEELFVHEAQEDAAP
ncbi:MAG: hypothetical protein AAF471_09795 [Myxococcota bacterium]